MRHGRLFVANPVLFRARRPHKTSSQAALSAATSTSNIDSAIEETRTHSDSGSQSANSSEPTVIFELQDIDLSVLQGSLVAVVGRIGSGKSSLLSAIIGDMETLGPSRIKRRGTLAYASQQVCSARSRSVFLTALPIAVDYQPKSARQRKECCSTRKHTGPQTPSWL